MAIRMERTCDFTASTLGVHVATLFSEVQIGPTTLRMDLCDDDIDGLIRSLVALGYTPSKARVGHNVRGAYVTASGRSFTTKEARTWLVSLGHELTPTGRLSDEQMRLYADSH